MDGRMDGRPDGAPETEHREARFLVVCTANICRSPMGEALLRHRLKDVGVDAIVLSTGQLAAGVEVSRNSVVAMAERGLDIAGRRSVVTSAKHVAGADVILTMGRSHVRKVIEVDLAAWPRTFPLRAAVRRALHVGPRTHNETLPECIPRERRPAAPGKLLDRERHAIDQRLGVAETGGNGIAEHADGFAAAIR